MHVDVPRELRVGVALLDQLGERTEIVDARESLETRAAIEQIVELVDLHSGLPVELEEHARVDVAAARAHDEAVERRHPHRRVLRSPTGDRGGRRTVAEVEHDLPQFTERTAEDVGDALAHVLVRRPVESVTADPILAGDVTVDRECRCGGGQIVEEGGVEDRDLRDAGKCRAQDLDTDGVGRVVQRREGGEPVDLGDDVIVDEHRLAEDGPAVHHAVTDRRERVRVEHTRVGELGERECETRAVIGDPLGAFARLTAGSARQPSLVLADALDEPLREHVSRLGVDELELDRRRARIDDEDSAVHASVSFFCAWIAVIATVLTMSWTSAPRERSLTGLFRPCSTGPTATAPALRCTAL